MSERSKKRTIVVVLVLVLMGMAVGFSLLRSNLTINSTGIIDSSFSILITDAYAVEYNTGVNQSLSYPTGKTLNFKVGLQKPKDKVEYVFKIENKGTIDAVLTDVDYSKMIDDSPYVKWDLVKLEEGNVQTKDFIGSELKTEQFHNYKLTIYFEESVEVRPQTLSLDMELTFNYTQ